tara:strand:- start:292 stop:537 length:246 start_codon:yes stop_codon:yes gene_type:complete
MKIDCKNMNVDKAIRILRRRLDRDGLKERIRELEYYEKPNWKRKRKKAAAVKRQQKIHREETKYLVRKRRRKLPKPNKRST